MSLDVLTDRQSAFVEAFFLTGGNAKESALQAGYAESVAKNAGREILGSASVQTAIEQRLRDLRDRAMVKLAANLDSVLDALIKLALDEKTPSTARQRALVDLLDRSGVMQEPARLEWRLGSMGSNGLDDFLEAVQRNEEANG